MQKLRIYPESATRREGLILTAGAAISTCGYCLYSGMSPVASLLGGVGGAVAMGIPALRLPRRTERNADQTPETAQADTDPGT